ncbi:MAG: carboxypeptidase regulatory-like domain-containing protein, partial [Planctomycetaceae bacterium]
MTLDGIPVEGASVSFEPVNGGRPCSGMTNAEGIYQITSIETNDGAPVGDHLVAIIKITGEGASAPAGTD